MSVDITSGIPPAPLYERVGGAWQLVQASFSYVLPRP